MTVNEQEKAAKWDELNRELPDLITESGNVFYPDIIEVLQIEKRLKDRIKFIDEKVSHYDQTSQLYVFWSNLKEELEQILEGKT